MIKCVKARYSAKFRQLVDTKDRRYLVINPDNYPPDLHYYQIEKRSTGWRILQHCYPTYSL